MKIGHLATVSTPSENDQLTAAVQELIDSNLHIETFHPWIGFRRGGVDMKGEKVVEICVVSNKNVVSSI